MKRIEALLKFSKEFYGFKLSNKISESEFEEVVAFIDDNDGLGPTEFERKINRWYLDAPKKPKNLSIMAEILMCVNSRAANHDK